MDDRKIYLRVKLDRFFARLRRTQNDIPGGIELKII